VLKEFSADRLDLGDDARKMSVWPSAACSHERKQAERKRDFEVRLDESWLEGVGGDPVPSSRRASLVREQEIGKLRLVL